MVLDYLQKLFGKREKEEQRNPQRGFTVDEFLLHDGLYNKCYQTQDQIHFGKSNFFSTAYYYAIFTVDEEMTAVVNIDTTMNTYHAKHENCIILDQPLTKVTPQIVTSLFPFDTIDTLKDDIPCLWYDRGLEAVVWEKKE